MESRYQVLLLLTEYWIPLTVVVLEHMQTVFPWYRRPIATSSRSRDFYRNHSSLWDPDKISRPSIFCGTTSY